jgi:hypothetical protein
MFVPYVAPKTNGNPTSGAQSQFCAIDDSESNGKVIFSWRRFNTRKRPTMIETSKEKLQINMENTREKHYKCENVK